MPHFKRNQAAADELLEHAIAAWESRSFRQPGPHTSDAIYCLLKAWLRLKGVNTREAVADNPRLAAKLFAGNGHHAFLQVEQDAEAEEYLDLGDGRGYHCTIDLDRDPECPEEIKSTRYSEKKLLIDIASYIEQVATYALVRLTKLARIFPLYLNGDYAKNRDPLFTAFDLTFEDFELVAWEKELRRRHIAMTADEPPDPSGEHHAYECDGCPVAKGVVVGGRVIKCSEAQMKAERGKFFGDLTDYSIMEE